MSNESLSDIDEIGEKTAASIIEFFQDENNRKLVSKLKSAGLMFIDNSKSDISYSLSNLTFVISGVFANFPSDTLGSVTDIESTSSKSLTNLFISLTP